MPMIERSSGTRRPEAAGALAHADRHLVGRRDDGGRPVGLERSAAESLGRGLGRPVRAQDPLVVTLQPELADRVEEGLEAVLGVWMWATFWGTAPM